METATNPVQFLRSLKGAPLSVLIAIRIFPGPASLIRLATLTGYDQHTCARATQALEAMGYITRAHYRGWRLTSGALQLPLWTPSELDEPDAPLALEAGELKRAFCAFQREEPADVEETPVEPERAFLAFQDEPMADEGITAEPKRAFCAFQQAEVAGEEGTAAEPKRAFHAFQPEPAADEEVTAQPKRAFYAFQATAVEPKREFCAFQPPDCGSSGSSLINPITRDLKPPLPPPAHARESGETQPPEPARAQAPFRPDEEALLEDLIDLAGCPRRRAEEAVANARRKGYFTPWLHLQVLHWHAYLADGRARSIQNPGYFVARKLEAGEACPFEEVRNGHKAQARELEYRLADEHRAAEASAPSRTAPA